jgi:hypothetical protein
MQILKGNQKELLIMSGIFKNNLRKALFKNTQLITEASRTNPINLLTDFKRKSQTLHINKNLFSLLHHITTVDMFTSFSKSRL